MRKVDEALARRFKITSFGNDGFTYYSSYTGGYWDILGFCHFLDGRVAVRLMHFEDEFLDDETFAAEKNASPYFSFNVSRCQSFLQFLETTILLKEILKFKGVQHFEPLNLLQLREEFHYSGTSMGRWYRYREKIVSVEEEKISLIQIPSWDKKYGIHQINALWFITVDTSFLKNDHFELIRDSYGLGTIIMTREALEEIISMIRETLKEIE